MIIARNKVKYIQYPRDFYQKIVLPAKIMLFCTKQCKVCVEGDGRSVKPNLINQIKQS